MESEPLRNGKRPPRSTKQHLTAPVELEAMTVEYLEAVEAALVERPVPHGPGIDVDKA